MADLNAIKGGLYGAYIGDALGATLEFLPASHITQDHTEIIGGGAFDWEPGEPTDDTELMMATARGIIAAPEDPAREILAQYIEWYRRDPKDVGICISNALNYFTMRDITAKNIQKAPLWAGGMAAAKTLRGRNLGNGALMRTLPVSFAYYENPDLMDYVSRAHTKLTHNNIMATEYSVKYNRIISEIIKAGGFKPTTPRKMINEVLERFTIVKTATGWPETERFKDMKFTDLAPSGYVLDTYNTAVWIFIHYFNFEKALTAAVNLRGDADTVGAVTGGLLGTYYGFNQIPPRWINQLKPEVCEQLDIIAERLQQISREVSE